MSTFEAEQGQASEFVTCPRQFQAFLLELSFPTEMLGLLPLRMFEGRVKMLLDAVLEDKVCDEEGRTTTNVLSFKKLLSQYAPILHLIWCDFVLERETPLPAMVKSILRELEEKVTALLEKCEEPAWIEGTCDHCDFCLFLVLPFSPPHAHVATHMQGRTHLATLLGSLPWLSLSDFQPMVAVHVHVLVSR